MSFFPPILPRVTATDADIASMLREMVDVQVRHPRGAYKVYLSEYRKGEAALRDLLHLRAFETEVRSGLMSGLAPEKIVDAVIGALAGLDEDRRTAQ